MVNARRFAWLVVMVGAVSCLLMREGTAEIKYASDKVAEAAKTPKVAEALTARIKMGEAFDAQDAEAVAAFLAEDLIVNNPANLVVDKKAVLGFVKAGRIDYEEADNTIEALDLRGDQLVVMGDEVVKPQGATANAGKIVRRRFTDVWRKESDGKWRLTIRQATITSVE